MNNVITLVSKKIVISLVIGLMLVGLPGYAKKRPFDEGPGASSNEPARKVQRGDTASDVSEGRPVAADGAAAGSVAPQGGDTYVGIQEALTCSFFSAAEPSQDPDDLQLVIGSERVIIPHSDFRSWCEQCLDAMNRRVTRSTVRNIKEQLEGVLTRVFAAIQEEGGAITRGRAQGYAQRFLSGQPVEVRLLFAVVADYLMSNFLSVVGWYGLAQEERVALSDIPFYTWELALQEHSLEEITQHDLDLHLLNSTPDRAHYDDPYHYIGLVLLSQTGNDEGHLPQTHFDILKWLTKTEVLGQEEIVRFFAETTRLDLTKMFGIIGSPSKRTFTYLFDIAAFLPSVTFLRLSTLSLDIFDAPRWEILRAGFLRIPNLTTLDLSGTNLEFFTVKGLEFLMSSLAGISRLTSLRLGANNLSELEEEKLAFMMRGLVAIPTLTTLDLGNTNFCELTTEKLALVMGSLANMPNLTALNLSSNRLGPLNAEKLTLVMRGLARMPNLTTLNFGCNRLHKLDEEKLSFVIRGLADIQNLTTLVLQQIDLAKLYAAGVERFACIITRGLANMPNLMTLSLGDIRLNGSNAESFNAMMRDLARIPNLSMFNVDCIYYVGNTYDLASVMSTLAGMPNLTMLNSTMVLVLLNSFDDAQWQAMLGDLRQVRALREVVFSAPHLNSDRLHQAREALPGVIIREFK